MIKKYTPLDRAWKRSESYQLPMTLEGQEKAEERRKGFEKGYLAGLKAAELALENLHREEKKVHKFYLMAKEHITKLRVTLLSSNG